MDLLASMTYLSSRDMLIIIYAKDMLKFCNEFINSDCLWKYLLHYHSELFDYAVKSCHILA